MESFLRRFFTSNLGLSNSRILLGTKCSSHAGLAIYVEKHLNFTIPPMYDSSDVWESLFIELKIILIDQWL